MNLSEARAKAWATRRKKYGPRGHSGSYYYRNRQFGLAVMDERCRLALALIVKLHNEEILSEGQCCKALKMDRIDFRKLVDES